jgi:magnesium transporter
MVYATRMTSMGREGSPSWLAEELSRLGRAERVARFRLLAEDTASAVFAALDAPQQRELVEGLRGREVRELLEAMEVDDRVRLLDELPAETARALVLDLSDSERELTEVLLVHPAESAGRIMTPRYLELRPEATVEQALEVIRRRSGGLETLLILPVRDRHRRLEGVVRLTDLVRSRLDARVADVMDSAYPAVLAYEDQEPVARLIQDEDLLAVPVVDREGRLVGLVTVDDAMEVIEREETEDLALVASASVPLGVPYHAVSVRRLVRARVVWLLFLVAAATLTVTVLGAFESTLEEVVTLAIFIPLLIGTGGNCGAQAATTMTRALAVGDVRFSDLGPSVLKEAQVGLVLGLIFALLGFPLLTVIWTVEIAASVSLALIAICLWGTTIGALLPLASSRLGVDPAVVSAPLVTTFVDATGLLIYFGIAHLLVL